MAGPKSASMNPGSGDARGVALRELPRKLAYMQTLWQKLLYVHWDAQALELVRRLAHEIRTVAVEEALAETAENARKLEQQLQILQSRNGPPPETERGRLQGLMQRLAHALLREALNRFRECAQAPMVAAASTYFDLMTGGRYPRLMADEAGVVAESIRGGREMAAVRLPLGTERGMTREMFVENTPADFVAQVFEMEPTKSATTPKWCPKTYSDVQLFWDS